MFCSNCGSQLQDGAGFCSKCGAQQGQQPIPVPPAAASLRTLRISKGFGFMNMFKVTIADGYIEVKGRALGAKVKAPINIVEFATSQRDLDRKLLLPTNMVHVALFSRGAEIGHADYQSGFGSQKAGDEAAQWINNILQKHRA